MNKPLSSTPLQLPPHFHAEYQCQQAIFAIKNPKILEGEFPKKLIPLLEEWTLEHKIELLEDWERAQKDEALLKELMHE